MFNSRAAWTSATLVVLMLGASLWTLALLPADAQVPIHFNASGAADGWAPAAVGLLLTPGLAAFVWLLMLKLPVVDPLGANLLRSATAYAAVWIGTVTVLFAAHAMILASALGLAAPVAIVMPIAVGLLLMTIGNAMGKLRWNYTVGIRTPWTIADERVWDKTHRFGGRALVVAGLAITSSAFVPALQPWQGLWIAGLTVGVSLLAVLKSYLLWREQQQASER